MNNKKTETFIKDMNELSEGLKEKKRIFFLGIGGIGMSALARVLVSRGYDVSGSDIKDNKNIQQLIQIGCTITLGHDISLKESDLVVYSSAISADNQQLNEARQLGIPIIHRSELLGFLMRDKTSIGITGTHGKTTTSALISFILQELRIKPTCIVGGLMINYNSNAIEGEGEIVIAEVDESDKSLVNLRPKIAVITNLDEEHLDIYADLNDIKNTLITFMNGMGDKGVVIYNYDDEDLKKIVTDTAKRHISFGMNEGAVFQAKNIIYEGGYASFDLFKDSCFVAPVKMPLLGLHNVYNALAAFAALFTLEIDPRLLVPFLVSFQGIARRVEVKYQDDDIIVIDDYAHHPTEISATIQALFRMKKPDQALTIVFQPHRYSRTMHLGGYFGTCFNGVDNVIVTDIYSAGENPIEGVDEKIIYNSVKEKGNVPVEYIQKDKIIEYLSSNLPRKAFVAFLGAGNITETADEFSNFLKSNR